MGWLPEHIDHYVEPFLGGGAVFFGLVRANRCKEAVLADRNSELIDTWRMVRDETEAVIEAALEWSTDEETYYEVRALDTDALEPVVRAARVLWLNRTGFNGLYRINKKGLFNVPYGRYERPRVVDPRNLRACASALKRARLVVADFEDVLKTTPTGAVVYCDPPYWPRTRTSSFTAYDGFPFRDEDQTRLAVAFSVLASRGVHGVLSNSWVPDTVSLYQHLEHRTVYARRNINRDGNRRGPIRELLVRNQPHSGRRNSDGDAES